jgi:hypothetical protein
VVTRLDLRPAGRRDRNNQNRQDVLHDNLAKGRSILQLDRGGSRRVMLSNISPPHAPSTDTLRHREPANWDIGL